MKLLVAYIATSGGEDAVALGACLARTFDAELEICIVIPPEPASAGDAAERATVERLSDALDSAARRWLDEAAAKLPDDIETTTTIAEHANPAEGLIVEADKTGADILVIGGAGGGISGRHTLGTVVNDILHASPIPVALAPPGFAHLGADEVREISVAIGDRPGTPLLFETALRSGVRAHRPIRLISLVAVDDVQPWRAEPEDRAVENARIHAQRCLDTARAELPSDFPVSSTVAQGTTIEEAVGSLEWHDGDVVMVGSSRLAAPNKLFLGTTAAKILRAVAVPMIVVPKGSD
ncbi:universal stress protein [Gordonia sp. zg691]|uniref:Universal stress protein n=1 Tax=Gordonia jinghuaiqii TaxID=2758710 RepID=A0A7D7LTW3_9ACTN|nr:universal stress protein [Gordonia jinghuaiqii]MBD0864007.1 universal stress protein [Gordonia jinghuaiqii]MCR5980555.1 universal stress protein [Gordonia jinghuaiqii]QMT03285.1 universal stress protein [Gordonia jinghuaiqii]